MPKLLIPSTFLCILTLHIITASTWEFAVTTKSKIIFYDKHWREVESAAHKFQKISTIAFAESEEIIYFNDRIHANGSIFSLKLPSTYGNSEIIENIVQRRPINETIVGIAYDPLEKKIYWTDKFNKIIYVAETTPGSKPEVFKQFYGDKKLDGIAIDFCRRTLYWTNSRYKSASIERMDLNGKNHEVIVDSNLFTPHGIVVDQLTDRLYWVDDREGNAYSVESSNLDGTDRQFIVHDTYKDPMNLVVTNGGIFWTESNNAIYGHEKYVPRITNQTDEEDLIKPHKVLELKDFPTGIVARTNFIQTLQNKEHCADVVNIIKNRLLTSTPTRSPMDERVEKLLKDYCLNGGKHSDISDGCVCEVGFTGQRCEVDECHNYCAHGTCSMNSLGYPTCECQRNFIGNRCHLKCSKYCLNNGICKSTNDAEPTCDCLEGFSGERCEQNTTEICSLFCRILKWEPEQEVPSGCQEICKEMNSLDEGFPLPNIHIKAQESCNNATIWTSNAIIAISCCIVFGLVLVTLIVYGLRHIYKPARPRIKKTFVVRKRAHTSADTPLTNRPLATEQCEITIENCCNMNICDTPCFDPKIVQQSLNRDSHAKEDKKILINNLEDELY